MTATRWSRDASRGPRRIGPPPDVVRSSRMQAAAPGLNDLAAMAGPMALPTSLLARLPTRIHPDALELLVEIAAAPLDLSALATVTPEMRDEYLRMVALIRLDPGLAVLADVRARRDRCQI